MKAEDVIKCLKSQFQVAEEVYGGFKTIISFTTLDAAQIYVGTNYTDRTNLVIIESEIKNIIIL